MITLIIPDWVAGLFVAAVFLGTVFAGIGFLWCVAVVKMFSR